MNNTFPCTKAEGIENGVADCIMAMLTDVAARTIAAQVIESMTVSADYNQKQ